MSKKTSVLVIDDDKVDRIHIEHLLKKQGYEVGLAATAEEGLKFFSATPADCVMVDYFLPDQNGISVLETLRQANPFLPIIIVTGMGDEMVAVDAIKHGAVDYFPKDCISSELLSTTITRALVKSEMSRKIHNQQFYLEHYGRILAQDIREPIRTIRSYLRQIHAREKYNLSTESQESLSHLYELLRTMESRVEKPELNLDGEEADIIHPVNAEFLVECALDCLEKKLKEKNLTVTCDALPTLMVNGPMFVRLFQSILSLFAEYGIIEQLRVHAVPVENAWNFIVGQKMLKEDGRFPLEELRPALNRQNYGVDVKLSVIQATLNYYHGEVWANSVDVLEGIGFSLPAHLVVEKELSPSSVVNPSWND